jgi:hypothetical protein
MTTAARSHRATTPTSSHEKPGLSRNASRVASKKCRTGKTSPTSLTQLGASSPIGMNTPDRNSSGRMIALTIGGPASAFGTMPETASPSAAKHPAPMTSDTAYFHANDPLGRSMPNRTTPNAIVIATSTRATSMECSTRADKKTLPGIGVPRSRLRIPSSRENTIEIAMFV